jgi:hypothetical protein
MFLLGVLGCTGLATGAFASDHGDTPELISVGRHDARLTDLHAWTVTGAGGGTDLVIAVSTNPNVPSSTTIYQWPEDLTVRVHLDHHSQVSFDYPDTNSVYGGRIIDPAHIADDIKLEISFMNNQPQLVAEGISDTTKSHIQLFAGLRDDPFINHLRDHRNVASIVLQMPLAEVIGSSSTILLWATTKVPDIRGPISEHVGRSLRSQHLDENALNTLRPRAHYTELGLVPDVMIFDTSRPAAFPNGRLLTDDVIVLVADDPLKNDPIAGGAPRVNDKPFLGSFPYLAEPWAP